MIFPLASLQRIVALRRPYMVDDDAFEATAAVQISYRELVAASTLGGDDTYDIGSCNVVEKSWHSTLAFCGDRDVENSFTIVVCFLKCKVTNVGSYTVFEYSDIQEVAIACESTQSSHQRIPPRSERLGFRFVRVIESLFRGKCAEINAVAFKHVGQLFFCMDCD